MKSNRDGSLCAPDEAIIQQLPPDGGSSWNRLIFASSPYLLQHAANPVDWYEWGDQAFEVARQRDVPVFLSIGYATCHWCHVMAHESFEDPHVGQLFNEKMVCIKVDKEERPDIDDIYMSVCQAMTGHGGWPLTVILDHDRKPFFAGTYFPKHSRPGRIGVIDLINRVHDVWQEKRATLVEEADRITQQLQTGNQNQSGPLPQEDSLVRAYQQLMSRYDPEYGGFGSAPKFPSPHNFIFLMRFGRRHNNQQAMEVVAHSLRCMRRGGVFDQVGLGFHRYATDERWLLPHFEKMLYDQAMIAMACLETGAAGGGDDLKEIARDIFTYVIRDMTSPEGGFYSAEDADSEGVEGKFYVWTCEEIDEILGAEDGAFYRDCYNFKEEGNFHEEATGHLTGDNIPHLIEDPDPSLRERLEACREKLFEVREGRIHPLKDDKILTDWNGLMIAAFAMGARILKSEEYERTASKAADYVLGQLRDDKGHLMKRSRKGQAGLNGLLDDYAFMIWGLLELYSATYEKRWLAEAIALCETANELFHDQGRGGFFTSSTLSEALIIRDRKVYDGAIPSGNSVMAVNLIRLARLTGKSNFEDIGLGIMKAFSRPLVNYPTMSTFLLCAFDQLLAHSREIVIVGKKGAADTEALLACIDWGNPYQAVLVKDESDPLDELAPFTAEMGAMNQKATAYVCSHFSCQQPTTDPEVLREQLTKS